MQVLPLLRSRGSQILVLLASTACSSDITSASRDRDSSRLDGSSDTLHPSGSSSGGGSTEAPNTAGTPANEASGGTASGLDSTEPVECAGIESAGFDLCLSSADACEAVFNDSSGCAAVCAAAGLECQIGWENVDGQCAADQALPAAGCDSGHQSDYCVCGRPEPGTGGAAPGEGGTGGDSAGTGGGTSQGEDCNDASGRPVVTVGQNGSQNFNTVQAAIDSLSNDSNTIVRIAPGTYYEKLEVNVRNVTLCGQTGEAENTILTYSDGADTPNGNGGTLGTSGSRSVNFSSDDVSVENLTFANTRGVGAQAVAVLASGDRIQFRNSRFLGHQDTLYVKGGTQYFRDSYIEGTVDFIFGGATAVFDNCTIHSVGGGSALTAPSTDQAEPFGLVFLGGKVTSSGVSNGSVALGRNWRPYGSTTFIETYLGAHISDLAWVKMGDNQLSTARFSEYQTTGPGAKPSARAAESKQLNANEAAAFTVDNILGDWDPAFAD